MFFALALLVFGWHLWYSGASNLSLLFDSQGYLALANSCQKLLQPAFLLSLGQYVISGFPESQRLVLLHQMGDAFDLVWAGPVIPLLLALVYNIFGKSAVTQNWQLASTVMLVASALIVPLLYLTAKQFWGTTQGRIAAVMALTYPPLAINSGRILTEVTAALAVALMLYLFALLVTHKASGRIKDNLFDGGLLTGLAIVLLMLSRPTLILLPWLVLAEIVLLSFLLRAPMIINKSWLIGLLVGVLLAITPWIVIKQIVTGKPSITVERGGAYNIWFGCNLETDGWDVLPSRLVTHPKEFSKSDNEVVSEIVRQMTVKPLAFVDLMARKPSRLMSAPWNDFQASFFGLVWPVQKWWQEVILLLAASGAFFGIRIAAVKKEFKLLAAIIVLCTFTLYFLIHIPVISMSRYFYAAMPAVLLLAAHGLSWLVAERAKRPFQLLAVLTVVVAQIFSMLDPSLSSNFWLAQFAAQSGVGNVALLGSAIVVVAISFWFWLLSLCANQLARLEQLSVIVERLGKRSIPIWLLASVVPLLLFAATLVCAAAQTRQELFCLEWRHILKGEGQEAIVAVPKQKWPARWLLVVDGDPDLKVKVNGQVVNGQLRPLWSLDASQRDNLIYLKAFAYAQGRNVENIRQWWCVEVPSEVIKQNADNKIQLLPGANNTSLYGDFVTPSKEIGGHSLSLRNFSWTKGFFADSVGEMRMDKIVRPRGLTNVWFQAPEFCPRVRLVAVADDGSRANLKTINYSFPAAVIGEKGKPQVVDHSLPNSVLAEVEKACRQLRGPSALSIRVTANYRALNKSTNASVCLIENNLDFAPMAPSKLDAGWDWQTVTYEDVYPIALSAQEKPRSLSQLRLLLAGVPWWDMLSYGKFKAKHPVTFENVCVKIQPIKIFNLDKQKWAEYQGELAD